MIFSSLSSGLKALETRLFCQFYIYSTYCDNKYYVKWHVNTCPGIDMTRQCFYPLCSGSGSGSGSGSDASLWSLVIMLFLQHVVINTLLFWQHNVVNHCLYWLLGVLNKFWTLLKRSHNKAFESFEHSFEQSFLHLVFNTR